jgi:hypothetical protein
MRNKEFLALAVYKLGADRKLKERLYDGISTYEEADLLAQLAMSEKRDDELIIIMPGRNRGIKNHPEEYERAKLLAEEYESEWAN